MIIDSSIWVATTTGLPARRAARVSCFWMPGTFSSGSSTPRSPRATISESVKSMISSSRSTACGFSILASTPARPRAIFFASAMSSGRWTNDSAIQSTPASSAASRSARSFGGHGGERDRRVGEADALAGGRAGRRPRRGSRPDRRSVVSAVRRILPSSSSSVWPGSSARENLRMRQLNAMRRRRARRSESSTKSAPGTSVTASSLKLPMRSFGPCRSTRMPIGRPWSCLDRADRRDELAHAVVRRVAHVDAEDVGARPRTTAR